MKKEIDGGYVWVGRLLTLIFLLLLSIHTFGQNSRLLLSSSGDNWGTQNVQTDNSINGNGTVSNPLSAKDGDGDTYFEVDEGGDDDVLRGYSGGVELFRTYFENPGHVNLIFNPSANQLDGGNNNIILGGDPGFPNRLIGTQQLRFHLGGYDNVIEDNIASATVAAHHAEIRGASTDHATIVGGSFMKILGGQYNGLFTGRLNNLRGQYSVGLGGRFMDEEVQSIGFNLLATSDTVNLTLSDFSNVISSLRVSGSGLRNTTMASRNVTYNGNNNSFLNCSEVSLSGNYNGVQLLGGSVASSYSLIRGINADVQGGNNLYVNGENPVVLAGSNFAFNHGKGNRNEGNIFSCVIGHQGKAFNQHQHVLSAGFYTENGDVQRSEYILKGQTTTPGFSELRMPNSTSDTYISTSRVSVPIGKTYQYEAIILGRNNGGTKQAAYKIMGLAINNSGTVTLRGNTSTPLYEDDSSWNAIASSSGSNLVFFGNANGDDARFVCNVRIVELKY